MNCAKEFRSHNYLRVASIFEEEGYFKLSIDDNRMIYYFSCFDDLSKIPDGFFATQDESVTQVLIKHHDSISKWLIPYNLVFSSFWRDDSTDKQRLKALSQCFNGALIGELLDDNLGFKFKPPEVNGQSYIKVKKSSNN